MRNNHFHTVLNINENSKKKEQFSEIVKKFYKGVFNASVELHVTNKSNLWLIWLEVKTLVWVVIKQVTKASKTIIKI